MDIASTAGESWAEEKRNVLREKAPDVSFIVASHNAAPYIEQAIGSALDQLHVDVEIIVVDDCSTDGTPEIVERLAKSSPRIRLFRQPVRQGPSAARNEAIARARGTWLAVLDADDFITPDRSHELCTLGTSTDADIVADNFDNVDQAGRDLGTSMLERKKTPHSFTVDLAGLMDGNRAFRKSRFSLGAIKPMIRRDFLKRNGCAYPAGLNYGEDYQFLFACLAKGGTFVVSSRSGYKYRKHDASLSKHMRLDHVDGLLAMHDVASLNTQYCHDAEVMAAAERYKNALTDAKGFLTIVSAAKFGRLGEAMHTSITNPRLWPLIARFGGEAVARRIGFIQ